MFYVLSKLCLTNPTKRKRLNVKSYFQVGTVAQVYNPKYLRGRDWENSSSRLAQVEFVVSILTSGWGQ